MSIRSRGYHHTYTNKTPDFVMSRYIKKSKNGRISLNVNYSYVQSFHIKPSASKAINEGACLRDYTNDARKNKKTKYAVMVFLGRFSFATENQIERYLKLEDNLEITGGVELHSLLEEMIKSRQINFFFLSDEDLGYEPSDGERIYCLDLGSRYILSNLFNENFLFWKMADNIKGCEIILKYLSSVEFYISLFSEKKRRLKTFEPGFNAFIGTRDIRFSAYFEVISGVGVKRYLLESVRESDIPTYFRKKVTEQISAFIERQFWRRNLQSQPEFVFLCENEYVVSEAARIYYGYFNRSDFYVTTDDEIYKGMKNAAFYIYDGKDFEEGKVSAFLESDGLNVGKA